MCHWYFLKMSYLKTTDSQVIIIGRVCCNREHCEWHWCWRESCEGKLPLCGVMLFKQRRKLEHSDLALFMRNGQMLSLSTRRGKATHGNSPDHVSWHQLADGLPLLPRVVKTDIFKGSFLGPKGGYHQLLWWLNNLEYNEFFILLTLLNSSVKKDKTDCVWQRSLLLLLFFYKGLLHQFYMRLSSTNNLWSAKERWGYIIHLFSLI